MVPLRIEALGNNVIVHLRGIEVVEKPLSRFPVAALVDMDRNPRRRVASGGSYPANAGLENARQPIPLFRLIGGA